MSAFAAHAGPPIRYEVIAASGGAAPGLEGVTFKRVGDPRLDALASIDDGGTIGFWTRLEGAGVTSANDLAFWLQASGQTTLLARTGDAAPGTIGTFESLTGLVVRTDGRAMFTGAIAENLGNVPANLGLFAQDAMGQLNLIDREAVQKFEIYAVQGWSASGAVAQAIKQEVSYGPSTHAAMQQAPGFANGVVFQSFSRQPGINTQGNAAFAVMVGSATNPVTWIPAVYANTGAGLQFIASVNASAPGTGGIFVDVGRQPVIDDAGVVTFWGVANVLGSDVQGLWHKDVASAGPVELLLVAGQSIPGLSGTVLTIGRDVQTSAAGELVASVVMYDGMQSFPAIVAYTPGEGWRSVAYRGQQAPDAPPAVHFSMVGPAYISASGQIAFNATLAGEGTTAAERWGIWSIDYSGVARLIARTGHSMDIPGYGSGTPIHLAFGSGGSMGGSVQFGASTAIAFRAVFADEGSGEREALLLAEIPCTADHDGSGFVDTDDFTQYVMHFEAGDPQADVDGSGFVDTDDFTAFVIAFENGC
jgi:hypothetical protein